MSEEPASNPDAASAGPGAAGAGSEGDEVLEQAQELAGSGKVRLRIDDSELPERYANGFRTNVTVEEVMLDFEMNSITNARRTEEGGKAEILFRTSSRLICNYCTANAASGVAYLGLPLQVWV